MTSKGLDMLNRLVDAMYRLDRGETVKSIAGSYGICGKTLYKQIRLAKANPRVVASVQMRHQEREKADRLQEEMQ